MPSSDRIMPGHFRRYLRLLVACTAAWGILIGVSHALHAQTHVLAAAAQGGPAAATDHHYCPLCALNHQPALAAVPIGGASLVVAVPPLGMQVPPMVAAAPEASPRRGAVLARPGRAPPFLLS